MFFERGLAANSEIKGADETDSKKQRKNLYRGIRPRRGRWGVEVRDPIEGVNVWVGTYDTPLEAALVYDAEAKRRRGKKARLNFPDKAPPKKPHPKKSRKKCKSKKTYESEKTYKCTYLPGRSASSSDAQGRNSNVEASARFLNGVSQIFQSDSPLQSRSVESPIRGYMPISSVETPLVPFHDQVQGINSENFMTLPLQSRTGESLKPGDMHISPVETPLVQFHDQVQGLNSENISEFVSNVQSVENHIEFWNMNSDYNRNYFDDWCSPQGVGDVNTSSALSATGLANWANIIGQAIMDIPEGILQNASSLIEKNVLQPQISQATLKSNSIEEPGMDSFLALLQFLESTGHADTSGTYIPLPEEWNFDDEMSKFGF
eukprot:PITA_11060